jgi:hypothetical protein
MFFASGPPSGCGSEAPATPKYFSGGTATTTFVAQAGPAAPPMRR